MLPNWASGPQNQPSANVAVSTPAGAVLSIAGSSVVRVTGFVEVGIAVLSFIQWRSTSPLFKSPKGHTEVPRIKPTSASQTSIDLLFIGSPRNSKSCGCARSAAISQLNQPRSISMLVIGTNRLPCINDKLGERKVLKRSVMFP
jgi:hypothetical protein